MTSRRRKGRSLRIAQQWNHISKGLQTQTGWTGLLLWATFCPQHELRKLSPAAAADFIRTHSGHWRACLWFWVAKASEAIVVTATLISSPRQALVFQRPVCLDGGLAHPGGWRKVESDTGSSCPLVQRGADSSRQGRTLHNRRGAGCREYSFHEPCYCLASLVAPSNSDYRNVQILIVSWWLNKLVLPLLNVEWI